MLLAFSLRDFDEIFRAQSRRFGQDRPRDNNLIIPCEPADNSARRLSNGSKLTTHLGKRNAGTDIRNRPYLYRLYETFKHIVK